MLDPHPIPPPPWSFKGHGWTFVLAPLFPSSPASILPFADHPGTTGRLIGKRGTLSLYRYTDSPIGPYDEISYSPGSYQYMEINHRHPSDAQRVTKSYVSCAENGVLAIRRNWGIPVEQGEFTWRLSTTGKTTVTIRLPSGEHITELSFQQTSFPTFTVNSKSILSDSFDLGRLFPLVQPLLDGVKVSPPAMLEPYSPLLQSAPLLKTYTSVEARTCIARMVHATTNPELFPPVEDIGVGRIGLELVEMDMTLAAPSIVLDVVRPSERKKTSRVCGILSSWIVVIFFQRGAR